MESCLTKLKYHFFARNHIQALLPNEPLTFCICIEKETWVVWFSKNEFSFEKTNQVDEIDTKMIMGKPIAMDLLSGNIRLSQLRKYNDVVYEGSFRHFLLLESVFWLCRDYDEQVEAVSF